MKTLNKLSRFLRNEKARTQLFSGFVVALLTLTALLGFAIISPERANATGSTYIYTEDFEDDTVGNVVNASNPDEAWYIFENYEGPNVISDYNSGSWTKTLKQVDPSESAHARFAFNLTKDGSTVAATDVKYIKVDAIPNQTTCDFTIAPMNGSFYPGIDNTVKLTIVQFTDGGTLDYWDGSSYNTLCTYSASQRYEINISLNYTDHTVRVVIGGAGSGDSGWYPMWYNHEKVTGIICDGDGQKDGIVYWDNLTVGSDDALYSSSSGGSVQKYSGNPVLPRGNSGATDDSAIESMSVIWYDGEYKLWYEGYDGREWRIHYANSSDGINWIKHGAVLNNTGEDGSSSNVGFCDPCVRLIGNKYVAWFVGKNTSSSSWHLLRATSDDGITWNNITWLPYTQHFEDFVYLVNSSTYWLYYSDNGASGLWRKVSTDGGFTWENAEQILSSSDVGNKIISPAVYKKTDGTWILLFSVYEDNNHYAIYYINSTNPADFSSGSPKKLLSRGESSDWDYPWVLDGRLINNSGNTSTLLVYAGGDSYTGAGEETGVASWNVTDILFSFAVSNQPPTVSITSPSEGATVNGTITITGTASDSDGTVQSVEVKIDSGTWQTATGTTSWSYSWDSTGVSDGTHTIYARSYDGTDYSTEDSVTVTVNNTSPNQPPTAAFTYSINDLTVTFTDGSTDSDGTIASWNWSFGDGQYSTTQNPQHTYSSYGTYSINLTVTDNDGATNTVSESITLVTGGGDTVSSDINTWYLIIGIMAFAIVAMMMVVFAGKRR